MKKKFKMIQVTAVVFAVIFCTLLGCERKEKEEDGVLLLLEDEAAADAGNGDLAETAGRSTEAYVKTGAGAEQNSQSTAQSSPDTGSFTFPDESDSEVKTLVVHICGAVKEPGVYIMDEGSRIYQAVEKAGGFEAEADENYLNQADMLSDGMKIYVPTQAEAEAFGEEIEWKTFGNSGPEAAGVTLKENGLHVNINTAGEAELTTIPGVGSSKARSIIAYREKNGMYRTIEDIMNVEGIKDGVFQKIKDYITV